MRSIIVFAAGFGSGWAVRSLADSPQGVGVALLKVAHDARERLEGWVAMERERLEDMIAEARASGASGTERADAGHGTAHTNGAGSRAPRGRTAPRAQA